MKIVKISEVHDQVLVEISKKWKKPSQTVDVTPFIGPVLMRVGGRDHAAAPC